MSKTITAVFGTRYETDNALRQLDLAGFRKDDITMIVSEEARGKHFAIVGSDKSDEGAATGATIGGLAGALYMALASAGTLLIPGLNLVVSGALIGGLVGLGAGALTGGLVGALVGMGIPEHEARLYEDRLRGGAILLAVQVETDLAAERVEELLRDANGQSVRAAA